MFKRVRRTPVLVHISMWKWPSRGSHGTDMLSAQLKDDISSTDYIFIGLPKLIWAVELGSTGNGKKRRPDDERWSPRLCERLQASAGVCNRLSLIPTPHELGFTVSRHFPCTQVMILSNKVAQTGSNPVFDLYFDVDGVQSKLPRRWDAFRSARG